MLGIEVGHTSDKSQSALGQPSDEEKEPQQSSKSNEM